MTQLMTVSELAEYLQIHPSTLYRLLKQKQIPAFRIGSDYRFEPHEVMNWLEKARHPTA